MISSRTKYLILFFCFACAVVGFLIKIPRPLRGNDKLLHTAFYFCAAAFLDVLFRRRLVLILIGLVLFGIGIEYLQELSNKLTHTRIHGRFDKEDIYANMKGLAVYLPVGLLARLVGWIKRKNDPAVIPAAGSGGKSPSPGG